MIVRMVNSMKRMNKPLDSKTITTEIAIGSFIIVCFSVLLLWRATRGFDWSDDTYASAIVCRILQGDALFKEIWDIHQFSAVILVPLFWIYGRIAGTTGLILFSRIFMVLVLSAESICVFLRFRKNSGCIWSTLAAILLLSFGYNFGLTYNTMMIEAFLLAFLLIPTSSNDKWKNTRYLFSGFISATAVQAYPTTIIVLVIFLIYIRKKERNYRRAITMYISGCLFVALKFLIFLSINSSFDAAIHNLHYLFMDPEHSSKHFSIIDHVKSIIAMIRLPGILILIAYLTALVSRFTKLANKKLLSNLAIYALVAFIMVDVLSTSRSFGKNEIKYHLYFSISLLLPVVWLLQGTKWDDLLFIWIASVFASVAVNMATNNGASFYVYPYLFAAMATLLYIGKTIKLSFATNNLRERILRKGTIVLSYAMVLFVFLSGFLYTYRDDKLESLDTQLKSGPAAGLFTTQTHAEQYQLTIDTINEYVPINANVLYTKLLPFGYMCSETRPATPRLWRTNLDYELFEEYYQINPQKKPDAIYIVNESYGITNEGSVIGDYMQQYIDNTPHETIELTCGTIIRFLD